MKVCHCYSSGSVKCLHALIKGLAELQTKLANLILGLKQPSIDEIAADANGLANPAAGAWGQSDANGSAVPPAAWGSSSPNAAAAGGWGGSSSGAAGGGWNTSVSPSNAGGGWGNTSSPAGSGGGGAWGTTAGWGSPTQQASGWNV